MVYSLKTHRSTGPHALQILFYRGSLTHVIRDSASVFSHPRCRIGVKVGVCERMPKVPIRHQVRICVTVTGGVLGEGYKDSRGKVEVSGGSPVLGTRQGP